MTSDTARKRRSSAEVLSLIRDAAYEEFACTGLAGASIRSIAERAGVTESMVFRHFSSKAELFQVAAAGPVVRYMYEFASSIASNPDEGPTDVTERFVSGLYDLCMANRRILISLAADASEDVGLDAEPAFDACLDALVRGINRYSAANNSSARGNLKDTVRLTLAVVLGATMSGNDLFPRSTDRSSITAMLAQFVLYGAGYRTPDIT
ncbi:TetR/AcrR family transcriptional regulator [Gordonia polyisoprenivorans]|uniref:TetR/AcrR family transcriptional regulator n=1 Tax=Gordonia polyisoprenivorans TaxID=84595 RepID=UPI001AD7DC45|nr:TetR/AcrR family transcriptional regulator [Gordonia polyisoprenivorans]QTI70903.1 TetR/AcrR family transcriptional regulator [Gordonia polyisoprenivorans]